MNSKLFYNKPAKYWTDALPLGNGSLGAMFFNGVGFKGVERIALNHDTLWTGFPRRIKKDGAFESYQRAKKLVSEEKFNEAQKDLEKNFSTSWSQAYLPLGDLYIDFGKSIKVIKDYKRELDLSNALLSCSYKKGSSEIQKEAFVSYPAQTLVYKISSTSPFSFSVEFKCKLRSKTYIENGIIITDGICPGDSDSLSPNYPCNSLKYFDSEQEQGISFRNAVKVVTDGKCVQDGEKLNISANKEAVIFLSCESNFTDGFTAPCNSTKDYKNICLNNIDGAVKKGYSALKEEHIADYKKYYDRVSLSLNKKNCNSDIPTDKRLKAFQNDTSDFELYELLYNYARYLMISSSRENTLATNLQGIWNENLKAPWNSNYTININTEMNYWCALACSLKELTAPLTELVKMLSVKGEDTAKDYYHANGFVAHHNTDIWGFTAPTTGNVQWSYFQGASGWLAHHLFEYYEYTLDKEFLKNTALPILKKASEFYVDILSEDENGNLIVTPSASPENSFKSGSHSVSVAKTSTIMNTIVLNTFNEYIKSCDILEIYDEFYEKISKLSKKINTFKIGSKGQLLEWEEEYEECDIHHRHVSHLIGLHPFNIINDKDTPEIFNACKKTLEIRGDDGTGWSLAWKINFHARLKNGEKALKLLDRQLRPVASHKKSNFNYGGGGGTYSNMFDAHPPFQIDGNFGAASGINEMLVQSDGESIYLLPDLPKKWESGCVKGLSVKGNATIDFSWENGKITQYKLHSDNKNLKVIV